MEKVLGEREERRLRDNPWNEIAPKIDKHITEVFRSIRGLRHFENNLLREFMRRASATYERGWSVGCSLEVRNEVAAYKTQDGEILLAIHLWCEIGWSSSRRRLIDALAAKDLYGEVVSAAAEIEARWQGEYLLPEREG